MGNHIEQLATLGFQSEQDGHYVHITTETKNGSQQVALYSCWPDGNFNGWGWHEIPNGRREVHQWAEMLAGLEAIELERAFKSTDPESPKANH